MSFSCARSLFTLGSHAMRRVVNTNRTLPVSLGSRWGLSQSERTLTRSMWLMCRTEAGVTKPATHTNRCQCCGIHTEGDKAISQFLTEEIRLEEKIDRKLPTVKGFELSKSGSSDVEFTKTDNGEIIRIKFNINNSVNDMEPQEDTQQEEAVQMISRPPFIFELTKGERTFGISLSFPESLPEGVEDQTPEDYEDEITIDSVAVYNKGQEWDENVYTLQGHNMDGTLYDMLLDMIEERGISDKFLDDLVSFSTTYEQQKYIGFLSDLKNFCSNS